MKIRTPYTTPVLKKGQLLSAALPVWCQSCWTTICICLTPKMDGVKLSQWGEVRVEEAIFLRLSWETTKGTLYTAAVLVYMSPSTNRFYLLQEDLIQLDVISTEYPFILTATQNASCECPARIKPHVLELSFRFTCTPQNNEKMEQWILEHFVLSTFNQCTHQVLPGWQVLQSPSREPWRNDFSCLQTKFSTTSLCKEQLDKV